MGETDRPLAVRFREHRLLYKRSLLEKSSYPNMPMRKVIWYSDMNTGFQKLNVTAGAEDKRIGSYSVLKQTD
jgi:hypothetical protein